MNRKLLTLICLISLALSLSGCGGAKDDAGAKQDTGEQSTPAKSAEYTADTADEAEVFEIGEKFFIQQCNDIYYNPQSYEGTVVKLEGIYDEYFDEYIGATSHAVFRNGPGCCGNDGVAGFVFTYDGTFPAKDDWIAVTGTVRLETYDDGYINVVLDATDVTVKDERGAEFVKN
jgi:uncharacterized membrane protein YcgQ (UPF0703/DUF1980 family)